MQAIRIYKIKIRENILRQIIFTNKNIFIGLLVLNIALIWLIAGTLPMGSRLLISLLCSGVSLLIFTMKIDGQSLIKIFIRMAKFTFINKKYRG